MMKGNRPHGMLVLLLTLLCLACCGAACADSLVLPADTVEIGEQAFMADTSLDEVILPEGLQRIGSKAFANSSVRRVYLPAGLTDIAPDAFDGCSAMVGHGLPDTPAAQYCAGKGILYEAYSTPVEAFTFELLDDTSAKITGYTGSASAVVIPAMADETHAVTVIGSLSKNKDVERVYLPEGLTGIGAMAFQDCTSLRDVVFNEELLEIGRGAFTNCTALLDADLPDSVTRIDYDAFSGCTALRSFRYPLQLAQAGFVGIFKNCPALTSVTVPEGVTDLAEHIFHGHTALEQVQLPSTLKTIGLSAFNGCAALQSISLPDSVTVIGQEAFRGCPFTAVTLPASLEKLDVFAFMDCASLADVVFNGQLQRIERGVFTNCTALLDADLPDSVTWIDYDAFSGCTFLRTFRYPMQLTKAGFVGIFKDCPALTSVTVPEGITDLAEHIFHGHAYLEQVQLPSTLTTIGTSAFNGCAALQTISLPDSITVIGQEAFRGCAFTAVTLPASLEKLDVFAFRDCAALVDVVFNDQLKEIGRGAFLGCSSLLDADLPDSVTTIDYEAFDNCTSLCSFHYPLQLTKGGFVGIFENCPALTDITVPEGITVLPEGLFREHAHLKHVVLPSTLKKIENRVFHNCTDLEHLYVPASVTDLGDGVFGNCTNLTVESEYGSAAITYCKENNVPCDYLTLINRVVPTGTEYAGQIARIQGRVVSLNAVTLVTVTLTNEATGAQIRQLTVNPNETSYQISALDGQLALNSLGAGSYRLTVYAETALLSGTLLNRSFRVAVLPTVTDEDILATVGVSEDGTALVVRGTVPEGDDGRSATLRFVTEQTHEIIASITIPVPEEGLELDKFRILPDLVQELTSDWNFDEGRTLMEQNGDLLDPVTSTTDIHLPREVIERVMNENIWVEVFCVRTVGDIVQSCFRYLRQTINALVEAWVK